ncbi:MAG TPA: DUF6444 domain-containing protein [Micromonosporaceae bacterium]|nr:DUF6444 domain-containing protein [Micromonosporaceae bacterium]
MSEASGVGLVEQLRRANAALRQALAVKDAEVDELLALVKAQGLRIAELERRLGSGSDDSGTPASKDPIGVKARRKAARQDRRQQRGSSRQRSADRRRGGQPGHPGHGLMRDPDPTHRMSVDPPAVCPGCGGVFLAGCLGTS